MQLWLLITLVAFDELLVLDMYCPTFKIYNDGICITPPRGLLYFDILIIQMK